MKIYEVEIEDDRTKIKLVNSTIPTWHLLENRLTEASYIFNPENLNEVQAIEELIEKFKR